MNEKSVTGVLAEANQIEALLEVTRSSARNGWNDATKRACRDLIAAMRSTGEGDIAIAEALVSAEVKPESAWLMLGYIDPPVVATKAGLRKRRTFLTVNAVGLTCLGALILALRTDLDWVTLLIFSGVALLCLVQAWIRLEIRARRAFTI